METFSVLLALCAGNSPVNGEFPAQRPVTRSFDVFFDLRLNKRLSKHSWGWWFETPSRSLWRDINLCHGGHVLPTGPGQGAVHINTRVLKLTPVHSRRIVRCAASGMSLGLCFLTQFQWHEVKGLDRWGLMVLPQFGGSEFNLRWVHDNFFRSLCRFICFSLWQSIRIYIYIYVTTPAVSGCSAQNNGKGQKSLFCN